MKNTLRIGIASYADMKARTVAIAKGTIKVGQDEPSVWFLSIESVAKILSDKNRALLELIAQTKTLSLTELAEKTGRKKSNLSRTLKTMASYGLVDLHKESGRLVPSVSYSNISLVLPVGVP